jgi:hypothetical protein
MWYRITEFYDTVILFFFIFLFYAVDWIEKIIGRFKKKQYYPYGVEVIEARNKELTNEIRKIADKHGVSYDVADSISRDINR